MNFLQISQRAAEECGSPASGLTSISNASGDYLQMVRWVNAAWVEIQQSQRDWMFMLAPFTLPITAVSADYLPSAAGVTDLNFWRMDSLRLYRSAVGVPDEGLMVQWDFETFRNTYRFGQQTPGRPVVAAIRPWDRALLLGPAPADNFTLTGLYQRGATEMVLSADVPILPAEFHMLIVYGAMRRYAGFSNAPEVYYRCKEDAQIMMGKLLQQQLPDMQLGEPLA